MHDSDEDQVAEPLQTQADRRHQALQLLDQFDAHMLPMAVARIARWRGCHRHTRIALRDELRQEIALDCLQNAEAICTLPRRELHSRWFRVLHRAYYRLFTRRVPAEPFDAKAVVASPEAEPDSPVHEVSQLPLAQELMDADRHGNGRPHFEHVARRMRLDPRELREGLRRLAERCGHDHEFLDFWRRRTAEALIGLAADLLRESDRVTFLPRRRPRPDPAGRLRRLNRIRAAVALQPLPHDLRLALSPHRLRSATAAAAATSLLARAAELDPKQPALPLWQFEAAVATGALDAGMRAVRAARRLSPDRTAIVLARARLLEARGRMPAAKALLLRAIRRHPREGRLRDALEAVGAAERQAADASTRQR